MLKAVVIGATGATGKELVEGLLQSDAYESVTVFVRKNQASSNSKLIIHQVDFDQPESWAHLVVGDVAFSALGTTLKVAGSKDKQWKVDYDYQFHFAKTAKINEIPSFVLVSAIGADAKSSVFYSRMKGALEQAIIKLNFERLLIFQPGLLIRPGTDRQAEASFEKVIRFFNRLGIARKYRPIAVSDLAQKMIAYSLSADVGVKIISSRELFAQK